MAVATKSGVLNAWRFATSRENWKLAGNRVKRGVDALSCKGRCDREDDLVLDQNE